MDPSTAPSVASTVVILTAVLVVTVVLIGPHSTAFPSPFATPRQRNGTSHVFIRCMIFEIQSFLIHAFQKVIQPCFGELGPHKAGKIAVAQEPCMYKNKTCTITLAVTLNHF